MTTIQLRTWHIELFVVAVVLGAWLELRGADWREYIGALAVAATFCHVQVADRMAERQATLEKATVECHRLSVRYLVAKEALWILYFVLSGSDSALVGCFLFLLYPLWRRAWRRVFPLAA